MRLTNRFAGAVLALSTIAMVAAVPLGETSARAASPPHWAQSPYYPTCSEGPCRVVIIADKTGSTAYSTQIRRWAAWMNYVRTTYNLNLPAYGYVQLSDPSCATAPGVISVCVNDTVVNTDCNNDQTAIRCVLFTLNAGDGHISTIRSSFRPTALDAADTWTEVCGALGRSIGLAASADSASCLNNTLTTGSGQEKYLVTADWLALFDLYNHTANT